MIKIGHASHDENGKYAGGKAGDQTGTECMIREWYNRPWNKVVRFKDATVAEKMAHAMEQATANNNIGYDQNQRTTLYTQAKACNWDLSKISTPCETDCSALVAVCANCAGLNVSKDIYTGNEVSALKAVGGTVLTASKYLTSDAYLLRGDVLVYEGHHTAIALENGAKATTSTQTGTPASTPTPAPVKKNNPYAEPTYNVTSRAQARATGTKSYMSTGTGVKWIQFELCQAGYEGTINKAGGIDGICGNATVACIMDYQKTHGLSIDGVAGKNTRAKMK